MTPSQSSSRSSGSAPRTRRTCSRMSPRKYSAARSCRGGALAEWRFDPNHSLVEVRARHMGISTLQAVFTKVRAEVHIDEADITKSWFAGTIDPSSIDVHYDRANEMFRGEAHLDAEHYPEIRFRTTRIEPR